jgi:hypothetical protein
VPECLIPHFWHENAIPRCVAEIQRLPQNGSVSGLRSLRWELSSVSSRCITGWGAAASLINFKLTTKFNTEFILEGLRWNFSYPLFSRSMIGQIQPRIWIWAAH